jgi:predicted nucleotidyltransferase
MPVSRREGAAARAILQAMISPHDRDSIVELAERYGASRVLLFGSSAAPGTTGRDIDLGVEGIAPTTFFRFYGDLILRLSKPVDVVDLGVDSRFTKLVRSEGVLLYGRA